MTKHLCVTKLTVLILITILPFNDSARILCVFPFPGASHQFVYRSFTEELLQLGHELVVVTTDPGYPKGDTPPNLTEIYVHEATQKAKESFAPEIKARLKDPYAVLPDVGHVFHNLFMHQFYTEEFQKIINDGKQFDLLILSPIAHSSLLLSHIFKVPVILVSSFGPFFSYEHIGVPTHEFLYPNFMRRKTFNVSFPEQMRDIHSVKKFEWLLNDEDFINKEFKKLLGDGAPTMTELWNNVDMLILNESPIWEGIRPVPQNVIHAGGILAKPNGNRELPQDIKHFLDSSVNGVIYVSFGTLVPLSVMSIERVQIMVNVFSKLPYDVLWKWDQDKLPGMDRNIRTFKWLPQLEIFHHPKVKLLITHGGLHSTDEAIIAGVPLIGIPFISDQFLNCDNYVRHNIGLRLDFAILTEEVLEAAITKVITDKSYRTNVVRLRALLHDQPVRALAQATRWVQYTLRHGGARHLHVPAAGLPWTCYLELELVAIVLAALALLTAIFMVLLYHIYKLLIKLSKKVWSRIIVWIRTR